ncbi:MAG: GNAT family N-acetyltransferase [Clostridiales Family XIII bacterium]|nr:GNAT family N-acetyltransferase [Clostridiales Family XIII bacterium]
MPELDFVGELDGEIVANIMYTKSKIVRPNGDELETLTFGPVSVAPELHRRGLGAEIIRHSLGRARERGCGAVMILGHPAYYPRFGFKPASAYNLTMPDGSASDAFMALELWEGCLGTDGGKWYEDKVFEIDQTAFEEWNKRFCVIDDYISLQPEAIRPLLKSVLKALRKILPTATEKISWQMPTFWQGQNLIHFAAQKNHLGIYPGAEAMAHFAPRLTGYKTSKGAVQFPYKAFGEEQLALISEIAAWRGENNAKR